MNIGKLTMKMQHPFEQALSVFQERLEFEFLGFEKIDWADFWLNPRRLRGSDFLMRWSQGVWSENRLTEAVNRTDQFFAMPYGPSGTAPDNDVRAYELYFERLEAAGLGNIKRPDLLIFKKKHQPAVEKLVKDFGGEGELPFIPEEQLSALLSLALVGIECENSLWVAGDMPAFGKPLVPQKRLGGKPGLAKSAVLPTVIIKEEDRTPLLKWQSENNIPIHIWHVFFDRAYGLALEEAEKLIGEGLILPEIHYTDYAIEGKKAYAVYYHYAYHLGTIVESPSFSVGLHHEENGKLTPYTKLEGGNLEISSEARSILKSL